MRRLGWVFDETDDRCPECSGVQLLRTPRDLLMQYTLHVQRRTLMTNESHEREAATCVKNFYEMAVRYSRELSRAPAQEKTPQ